MMLVAAIALLLFGFAAPTDGDVGLEELGWAAVGAGSAMLGVAIARARDL